LRRPDGRVTDRDYEIDMLRDELGRECGRTLAMAIGNSRLFIQTSGWSISRTRTPQRIENRACNDPGIITTDMKPISCGLPSMRVMCLEYSIRNQSF